MADVQFHDCSNNQSRLCVMETEVILVFHRERLPRKKRFQIQTVRINSWQENQVSFVGFLFRIVVHETQRTKVIVSSGLTENIEQFSVSCKNWAVERRTGMRLNRYEFIKPTLSLLMLLKLCSLHLWSDRPLLHKILTTRQSLKLH